MKSDTAKQKAQNAAKRKAQKVARKRTRENKAKPAQDASHRVIRKQVVGRAARQSRVMGASNGGRPTIRPLMALRPKGDASEYELLIYGDIGESWFDTSVTALSVVQQLQALDSGVKQITVRINSYGGSVSDGLAIYNALKRHPARKVVTVDGVAMSSASVIAMVGDEVQMPAASLLMIHAPWGLAQGNAMDMRVMADVLDTYAETMAAAYAAKTGKPKSEMLALLDDGVDHYYTGDQAVAAGFADALIEDPADEGEDDTADARAAGVQRFTANAPKHIAQMAIAAAARHPTALPPAAKPRIRADSTVKHLVMFDADEAAKQILSSPEAAKAIIQAVSGKTATPSTGEEAMPPEVTQQAAQADPAVDAAAITAKVQTDVQAKIRARNDEIKTVLEPYAQRKGVQDLLVSALADPTMTIDSVRAKALELVGREATPAAGGYVEVLADESETFRAGVSKAMLIRAGMAKNDGANPFRGYSLREIARACVERSGKNTRGMDVRQIVAIGFTSTSDFPLLLGNTAKTALLAGYEEAPESYPLFTRAGTLTDFKEVSRAGLGIFSSLDKVPEGGEYKYGTFGENGAKVVLATYGKLFAITRQAIINDDLGAFTDVPRKMGRAAKRTIGDLVFAILTTNPTMDDGYAVFESTHHKNLQTGAAITTASVDAMQTGMATQKGPDGQPINVGLRYLLVPRALQGAANTVLKSEYEVGASARNNTTPNSVRDSFEIISDARLDAFSTTAWFGSADPALVDTIEVDYLDGQQEPYLDQKQGWDVDGTEFKVRIDAGVTPVDYRGLQKNPGP